MKAGRIHYFGPPNAIVIEEIPRPAAEEGELVVRVVAAGVGPWDALIREGKSVVKFSSRHSRVRFGGGCRLRRPGSHSVQTR